MGNSGPRALKIPFHCTFHRNGYFTTLTISSAKSQNIRLEEVTGKGGEKAAKFHSEKMMSCAYSDANAPQPRQVDAFFARSPLPSTTTSIPAPSVLHLPQRMPLVLHILASMFGSRTTFRPFELGP